MGQIYNEEVNDLLASDNPKLQIHESRESGVYVAGLREDIVTSSEHVLQLLEEGELARHTGETKMNKNSSRSHTIFRMVCTLSLRKLPQWVCSSRQQYGTRTGVNEPGPCGQEKGQIVF